MKLNLKNPIVFFDLETTGTNINTDRIVEICYLKVYQMEMKKQKHYVSILKCISRKHLLLYMAFMMPT